MQGLTELLTRFVLETPSEQIPELARENATRNVVDTIGCMVAGSRSEVREPVERVLGRLGGAGSHTVAATAIRTNAPLAAMANGTFGHALDFDDTLSMMPAHPSTVVLSALFTAMGSAVRGEKLLDAYIVGVEVGAKLGLGIGNGHYRRGFHATGTLTVFSAIAALARLLDLPPPTFRAALGIGASMASGLRCNFGTMVKPLHAGWAAHNAVVAVELAGAGMTANESALEAEAGFFAAYGTDKSDMGRFAAALGKPFVVATPGVALKKFPCIYLLHRPIDALQRLRERLGMTPENVEAIECRGAPGAFLPLITHLPTSGLESKFSLEYVLAVAAIDGRYDLAAFSDEACRRASVAKIYPRVRKIEDARCLGDDPTPGERSAGTLGYIEVTVRLRGGAQETIRVDRPPGSPERPLEWADLKEKFMDCALYAGFAGADATALFEAWKGIRRSEDVRGLVAMWVRDS